MYIVFALALTAQAQDLVVGDPLPGIAGQVNSIVVTGAEPQLPVRLAEGTLSGGWTPVPGCPGLHLHHFLQCRPRQ